MSYGIKLLVWGEFAAFNRPEMKVERVSYDVMTPSAARGILEAVYWKPQMRWIVDRIHVLNPIRYGHVRRNEISCTIPVKGATGVNAAMKAGQGSLGIAVESVRQQRAARVLRDVRYGVAAHLVVLDPNGPDGVPLEQPEGKHLEMFKRRASRGQCFHRPYLGCREFPAHFELVEEFPDCPEELRGTRQLGFVLNDLTFTPDRRGHVVESNRGRRLHAEPHFFEATMIDGVIDVPRLPEAGRVES